MTSMLHHRNIIGLAWSHCSSGYDFRKISFHQFEWLHSYHPYRQTHGTNRQGYTGQNVVEFWEIMKQYAHLPPYQILTRLKWPPNFLLHYVKSKFFEKKFSENVLTVQSRTPPNTVGIMCAKMCLYMLKCDAIFVTHTKMIIPSKFPLSPVASLHGIPPNS